MKSFFSPVLFMALLGFGSFGIPAQAASSNGAFLDYVQLATQRSQYETAAHIAPSSRPTTQQTKECRTFLAMSLSKKKVIAKSAGTSIAMAIWGCKNLIRLSQGQHATSPYPGQNDDAEPAWYGNSCEVTRFCPANNNCIRGMCQPNSYGGCDNGYDSCPAGESCVSGNCQ